MSNSRECAGRAQTPQSGVLGCAGQVSVWTRAGLLWQAGATPVGVVVGATPHGAGWSGVLAVL